MNQVEGINFDFSQESGVLKVGFSGDWLLPRMPSVMTAFLEENIPVAASSLLLQDNGIGEWDSGLLLIVHRLRNICRDRGIALDFGNIPEGARKMIEMAQGAADKAEKSGDHGLFYKVGDSTRKTWHGFCEVMEFLGEFVMSVMRLFGFCSRMRSCDFSDQLSIVGPRALCIVSLIAFLMGLILAFIGAIPLQWFKAEIYVSSLVGIGMLRMLAPVMVAVVMAGRSCAAYAAELGTMRVNQEIDAFTVLGVSVMDFLIMPRFLAMFLMFPVLTVYADIVSIIGGAAVAMAYLDISWMEFYSTLIKTVRFADFYVGIASSIVFGLLVAICGCYHGVKCGRNASAVGNATTAAVVHSIVCVVIATAIITLITVIFRI